MLCFIILFRYYFVCKVDEVVLMCISKKLIDFEKICRVYFNCQKKSGVIFWKDLKGFMIYIKFYSNYINFIEI